MRKKKSLNRNTGKLQFQVAPDVQALGAVVTSVLQTCPGLSAIPKLMFRLSRMQTWDLDAAILPLLRN